MTEPPPPLEVSSENYASIALEDDRSAASAAGTTTRVANTGSNEKKDGEAGRNGEVRRDAEVGEDGEDVDADDQALVAQRRERRTELTDEEFERQRGGYDARVEGGDIWKELLHWSPPFRPSPNFLPGTNTGIGANISQETPQGILPQETKEGDTQDRQEREKQKLDKKQHQLLQAAIAELYWQGKFKEVEEILTWAGRWYVKDGKFEIQLEKWGRKAGERLKKKEEGARSA